MVEDYRATGVNLGEHPLALLRSELGKSVTRSSELRKLEDGEGVEVAGMVVARQRPETAKGITFMLLEDERGTINLIVPSPVYERCRSLVRTAPLLRLRGRLERREGSTNVIVSELRALEWHEPPKGGVTPMKRGQTGPPARVEGEGGVFAGRRRARELAVAELRAVAPAGHSFGRRGALTDRK